MNDQAVLVTGVGGQGIILASDIMSEVAMTAGYDVKKTDTIGMAQRGGSVLSHVRMGKRVFSPLIPQGKVDLLLAFEKLEAARWANYIKPGGTVVINGYAQPPLAVNLGYEHYPTDGEIQSILATRTSNVHFVDGNERARVAGDVRALNSFMLGCASRFLDIDPECWKSVISQRVPAKSAAANLRAFDSGREEMKDVCCR